MYENFFGLVEKPFSVTPDTRFLYSSSQYENVIKTLEYGINDRRGFLLLTGEVGTGKTTSIRALVNQFPPMIKTSVIFNPLLSTLELIQAINEDFVGEAPQGNLTDQLATLNRFLLENDAAEGNAVVIIDEAQNLSEEALEMTRLLSNLETETHKLVQIILVGQPELLEKLGQPNLRQLAQRIQIRCELQPLDLKQIVKYVWHRIHRAGNNPKVDFDRKAFRKLYKISGGIPRRINTLCELALLAAYSREEHMITDKTIGLAAKEVFTHVRHP
jgi:general secretion pathway protein A